MKKILIVITCILLFPSIINASNCDYKREVELNKLASKISYSKVYDKELGVFNITLYNVIDELYIIYDGYTYSGDEKNEILIENVEEGKYLNVVVYSTGSSCYSSLMTIYITVPYYNKYYNSVECEGYEDVLTVCSSQFLTYKIDPLIFQDAINNYKNKIKNDPVPLPGKNTSIITGIKEFVSLWGMKILLAGISIGLSVWYFQVKLRKTKHGI